MYDGVYFFCSSENVDRSRSPSYKPASWVYKIRNEFDQPATRAVLLAALLSNYLLWAVLGSM